MQSMQNSNGLVVLHNIHKSYHFKGGWLHVIRGISLKVQERDFICVMGPSGSGKTTLMNIMGLLDTPTEGEVYFWGHPTKGMSDAELSRLRGSEIGFVFQVFNLIPRLTALQNVMLPMSYVGKIPKFEWRRRAEQLLADVGLLERMHHKPAEMSGGEMQRVAIARALANDPSLILADEPTGNLDSETGRQIMDIFRDLNQSGRALMVVTHNPEVARYASRILEIRDGRLINQ